MNDRNLFALLTLFFNNVGLPCFLLGKTKAGILRIVLGFVTFGIVLFINGIMGIIEAVKIFQMSDEEFAEKKQTLLSGIPSGL